MHSGGVVFGCWLDGAASISLIIYCQEIGAVGAIDIKSNQIEVFLCTIWCLNPKFPSWKFQDTLWQSLESLNAS